jgi:hypothetical protein
MVAVRSDRRTMKLCMHHVLREIHLPPNMSAGTFQPISTDRRVEIFLKTRSRTRDTLGRNDIR